MPLQIWYSDSCKIACHWSPPWRVSRCKLIRNTARSVAVFHGSQATTKGRREGERELSKNQADDGFAKQPTAVFRLNITTATGPLSL